jgi:hypothetical protein
LQQHSGDQDPARAEAVGQRPSGRCDHEWGGGPR